MELFAIHCTTCKARLIVKDEAAIGDILSCPKCHSMVQVVPPPGWVAPSVPSSSTDVAAAPVAKPRSAPPTIQSTSPKPAPSKTAPSKAPISKAAAVPAAAASAAATAPLKTHATPPPLSASHASASDIAGAAAPPALPQRIHPADAPEHQPDIAAASTESATTIAKGSNWTLLGAGIGSGVLLGALAWLTIWLMSPADAPAVASVASVSVTEPAGTAQPSADTAQPSSAEVPVSRQLPAGDVAGIPAEGPPAEAATTTAEPALAVEPAVDTAITDAPADAAPAVTPSAIETATTDPPVAQPPASAAAKPELKLDPVAPRPAASTEATPPRDSQGEALPAEAHAQGTDPEHSQADAPLAELGASAGEPALLSVVEIQRRLGTPLARVDFSSVPIGQLAAFLSDVSGARVVVDEPSLAKTGKSRKTPITVKLTGGTALAILEAAAEQAGLDYKIEPGRITLTARGL